jgi:hypothetical protein
MSEPIAELGGATWGELEVKQHENGALMFPAALRRRDEKGNVVEKKVRVRVPVPGEHVKARVETVAWFGRLKDLDRVRDKDLFDELEQLVVLARSIRDFEPPHAQFCAAEDLAEWDEASLKDIRARINLFKEALEPEDAELSDEQFWLTLVAVGRSADIGPLADIAGRALLSFVVRTAKEALLSPNAKPWLRSSETSTLEPSASKS